MSDSISSIAEISSFPVNSVLSYMHGLKDTKVELPHGQLVCVSASPSIVTTEALLRLATSIGPYIAILQVHADIIDDWSSSTVHELTLLAKKYNFLLWEGGRLLNACPDVFERSQVESRERRREDVSMVRRRYVNGVVSAASWAGLATSFASAVPAQQQESDILIPMLKGAARETVAKIAQVIRTEITVDRGSTEARPDQDSDDTESDSNNLTASNLRPVDYSVRTGLEPPVRRASTISLTRSITQHSEPSSPSSPRDTRQAFDNIDVDERVLQYADWSNALSPPPLLARALVLCLPSTTESPFTAAYRDSCLAAAWTNRDFVVGFLCNEPWTSVSRRSDLLEVSSTAGAGDKHNGHTAEIERDRSFMIFSPLQADANTHQLARAGNATSSTEDRVNGSFPNARGATVDLLSSSQPLGFSPQASILHNTIARAIASSVDVGQTDPVRRGRSSPLHIPIVTLGM